jgi:hypothetical protein
MDKQAFEAAFKNIGQSHVEDRPPGILGRSNARLAHDYDIRGLVMNGTFIVWQNDKLASCGAA